LLVVAICLIASHASAQGAGTARGDSPFALHAGAAYARLADGSFERVQALSGQDLFSQTTSRESDADFVVLVSHRLWPAQNAGARAYASLGTNVSDPGATIYLGGSIAFSRAFATLGVATTLVEQGVGAVPDQVFRGSGDRTLFASLDHTRDWGFFMAVSFSLIQ
jgi:hypothetical protein